MESQITKLIVQNEGQQKDIDYIKDTSRRIEEKVDGFVGCLQEKADKKEVDDIQTQIDRMKDKREERSYDWLKYSIATGIGVGTALLVSMLSAKL